MSTIRITHSHYYPTARKPCSSSPLEHLELVLYIMIRCSGYVDPTSTRFVALKVNLAPWHRHNHSLVRSYEYCVLSCVCMLIKSYRFWISMCVLLHVDLWFMAPRKNLCMCIFYRLWMQLHTRVCGDQSCRYRPKQDIFLNLIMHIFHNTNLKTGPKKDICKMASKTPFNVPGFKKCFSASPDFIQFRSIQMFVCLWDADALLFHFKVCVLSYSWPLVVRTHTALSSVCSPRYLQQQCSSPVERFVLPASDLLHSDNSETPLRNLMQEIKRLRNEIYNSREAKCCCCLFLGSRLKTILLMWTHLWRKV